MAKKDHYYTPFETGNFYHIYNRSIDRKPLFTRERNYRFFLEKLDLYMSPVLDVYAWCLMNNHFHLMVRVKDLEDFKKLIKDKLTTLQELTTLDVSSSKPSDPDVFNIVSHSFQKMFQSYAMAFNKQENRVGSLFQSPLKRNLVDDMTYFTNLIYYIHANPQLHGFVDDFRSYPWSSYRRILSPKPSKLMKNEVLNWFGGRDHFEDYHASNQKLILPDDFIED